MGKWKMVRLGDVAKINMGQSPASETYNDIGKGLPFFQGKTDFQSMYPTIRMFCSAPQKTANKNDILMSVRAPVGVVNIATQNCCIGRGLAAISETENVSYYRYLFYYLRYKENDIANMGVGSTFKAISRKDINMFSIPLPPLKTQQKIADMLDKASALIELRKAQLEKLDLLIKSKFIEMFGNASVNSKDYKIRKLGDLALKITDGVHAKPNYTMSGRPFLSVVNINKRKIDFTDCKFVSEEDFQTMTRSTHPQKGDVLYTKVGATYGIPAYVDTDKEFCLYVSVCLIKPIHKLVNSQFLALSMDMPYIKRQADNRIKGIGVPDLHLNQIREFDILCPPIEEQESYVQIVSQINRMKFTIQQSLDKLELNYKSLMQKCFRGEIF